MDGRSCKIVIATNHCIHRAGLVSILRQEFDDAEIEEAEDIHELISVAQLPPAPTLFAIDLDLPGMLGMEGVRRLRMVFPDALVVVIASERERGVVLDALAAGVHGFVPTDFPARQARAAFRTIMDGQIYVPPTVCDLSRAHGAKPMITYQNPQCLTGRQREVLDLLGLGLSNKEIGDTLHIAESTVKVHLAAVFRILGVRNRLGAMTLLRQQPFGQPAAEPFIPGLGIDGRRAGEGAIAAPGGRAVN